MAALITERHGLPVRTTPSPKAGEFTVLLDGRAVARKWLPFVRPGDEKILGAVAEALADLA